MCGIAAIVRLARGSIDPAVLKSLCDAQRHRGPDGEGQWIDADLGVGLGHRRLAIIDPDDRAAQPFLSSDSRYAITFNGEIYNYRALRQDLSNLGHQFRTTSDTEVLVEGFAEWGKALLPKLRGMFAFALVDRLERSILLARDALGIKPLYWTNDGTQLLVASEIKALSPHVSRSVDPSAIADLLLWGSIAAPRTALSDVRSLQAGHLLEVSNGVVTQTEWTDAFVAFRTQGEMLPSPSFDVEAAITDSIRAHLEADVPVGAFLSAGVDSGVVVAKMAALSDGLIRTITVRNDQNDESSEAAQVAGLIGVEHLVLDLRSSNVASDLAGAIAALDQPSIDGVNTFLVSKAAASAGLKVALSGIGGDELFGGYASFRTLPRLGRLASWVPSSASARFRSLIPPPTSKSGPIDRILWLLGYLGPSYGPYVIERAVFAPDHVARLTGISPAEVLGIVEERLASSFTDFTPNGITELEGSQYLRHQLLRDTDAVSMSSSLEVRTPLVDANLYRALALVDGSQRTRGPAKQLLRETVQDATLQRIWSAPKRGFALAFDDWFRDGSVALQYPDRGLDRSEVDRIFGRYRSGDVHWSRPWLLHVLATNSLTA